MAFWNRLSVWYRQRGKDMEKNTTKQRDRIRFMRAAVFVMAASVITAVTAILPMVASVGKLIYANNVAVVLVSMGLGPVGGACYAAAASAVLNNIGMGSGVIPYVLLFQMAEAAAVGILWHGKRFHIVRCLLTVLGGTFLLKPLSFLLYYGFNRQFLGGLSLGEYMAGSYENYLRTGWTDTLLLYATGILTGYLLKLLIDYLIEKRNTRKEERS